MKKIILTAVVFILSSISFFAVAGDDVDPRRARLLSSNGGVSAPPEDTSFCSKSLVEAFRNGDIEQEDLPATCQGFDERNSSGSGTEIYGDANSGYMRDGEYVEEWGITGNGWQHKTVQFKYGPYDEILSIEANTNTDSGGRDVVAMSSTPAGLTLRCIRYDHNRGIAGDNNCQARWKITARKTSTDVSSSDYVASHKIYTVSHGTSQATSYTESECILSSQTYGREVIRTCAGGSYPFSFSGVIVKDTYFLPKTFYVKFGVYQFSDNLKIPGEYVGGDKNGAPCDWENANFTGCSVAINCPSGQTWNGSSCVVPAIPTCPNGQVYINNQCMSISI